MSDDVGSVRTRIEAVYKRFVGEAEKLNEAARAQLERAAKELRATIGESNQAEAEPVIQELEQIAKQYPGLSEQLKQNHENARAVGAKM